jgi:hypothetical protein
MMPKGLELACVNGLKHHFNVQNLLFKVSSLLCSCIRPQRENLLGQNRGQISTLDRTNGGVQIAPECIALQILCYLLNAALNWCRYDDTKIAGFHFCSLSWKTLSSSRMGQIPQKFSI